MKGEGGECPAPDEWLSDLRWEVDKAAHRYEELLAERDRLQAELTRMRIAARWVVGLYASRLATDDDLLDQLQAPMRALDRALDESKAATDG